jgi:hypothetical protein
MAFASCLTDFLLRGNIAVKLNKILKTTDGMLELLFYNTREAIACVDAQGCLVEVNQPRLQLKL